jgi:hypothetical protein
MMFTDSVPNRDHLHVSTKNMAMVRNSDILSGEFKVSEIDSRRTGHLDGNNNQLSVYSS